MNWPRFLIIIFAGMSVWAIFLQPVDDSDVNRWSRSGMKIHKDALTGCEYFAGMFGGPTPRMDADGKQICRKGRS